MSIPRMHLSYQPIFISARGAGQKKHKKYRRVSDYLYNVLKNLIIAKKYILNKGLRY